jgi:uncharacterized protein YkwD
MKKLSLLLGMVITISGICFADTAVQTPASSPVPVMTQEEQKSFDLVNKERAQRGLSQLTVDPLLITVARAHSREMDDKHYFSHTSPTIGLSTPMDRYLAAFGKRPTWLLVGENLFYCSVEDGDRAHSAFMHSPGHRANILEPRYEKMGVGVYVDKKGEFYVTQMYLAKRD